MGQSPPHLEPRHERGGLVVQDPLNLLHNLGRQLVQHSQRPHILIHLLDGASPHNRRRDVLVLDDPPQRQRAHLDAESLGDGRQAVRRVDPALELLGARVLQEALDELHLRLREARVGGDTVLVLARKDALLHGGEDGGAEADLAEEVAVLAVDRRAVPASRPPLALCDLFLPLFTNRVWYNLQHVVLRLLDDGANEPQPVRDPPRSHDFGGAPLRRAPVKGLVGLDEVVEGPHRLLHGGVAVGAVGVDDVDVVEAEALERVVHALDDVLPGEALVVDGVVAECGAPVELVAISSVSRCRRFWRLEKKRAAYLGRDDQVVPLPSKLLDRLAHDDLGLALGVHLGRVEEVDAAVVRRLHAGQRALCKHASSATMVSSPGAGGRTLVDMAAVGEPAAERDGGDLEAGPAQKPVLHGREIIRLGHCGGSDNFESIE